MEKLEESSNDYIEDDVSEDVDRRVYVDLSALHNITEERLQALMNLIPAFDGIRIADAGCGTGDVIERLLLHLKDAACSVTAIDFSRKTCAKLRKRFEKQKNVQIVRANVNRLCIKEKFDVVIAKQLLHEMSVECQKTAIEIMLNSLNPDGRLIIWDFFLKESAKKAVSEIIREKDRFCGYKSMAKHRQFLTYEEFVGLCGSIGVVPELNYAYIYRFSSKRQMEFEEKPGQLSDLNDSIRTIVAPLSDRDKEAIKYEDKEDDISFDMESKILIIRK